VSLLDGNASCFIVDYDRDPAGRHYNSVAGAVYRAGLEAGETLSPQFEPAILDGLMGFGMGIAIKGGRLTLEPRLRQCMEVLRNQPAIRAFKGLFLSSADFRACESAITAAYNSLALAGTLHPEDQSHVGATKTLHWLFPNLFLMVDSHAARAYRTHFAVGFRKGTQPGYSSDRYLACLRQAQREIQMFGVEAFQQLEPGTPEARIFDKIAFVVGKRLK
jgi:hypothetical protein